MITRATIDGKQATVTFLNAKWEPCEPKEAKLAKIMFDDGGCMFGAVTENRTEGKG